MAKNDLDGDSRIEDAGKEALKRQIRFVEDSIKTQYANVFNIGFGAEEVVFLFGNHSVDPNVVRIESKIAVSLKTAKRFAVTLGNLLKRYEAVHGELDISVPKPAQGKPNIQ